MNRPYTAAEQAAYDEARLATRRFLQRGSLAAKMKAMHETARPVPLPGSMADVMLRRGSTAMRG